MSLYRNEQQKTEIILVLVIFAAAVVINKRNIVFIIIIIAYFMNKYRHTPHTDNILIHIVIKKIHLKKFAKKELKTICILILDQILLHIF